VEDFLSVVFIVPHEELLHEELLHEELFISVFLHDFMAVSSWSL